MSCSVWIRQQHVRPTPSQRVRSRFPSTFDCILPSQNIEPLAIHWKGLNVLVGCIMMSAQCGEWCCIWLQDAHPMQFGAVPASQETFRGSKYTFRDFNIIPPVTIDFLIQLFPLRWVLLDVFETTLTLECLNWLSTNDRYPDTSGSTMADWVLFHSQMVVCFGISILQLVEYKLKL